MRELGLCVALVLCGCTGEDTSGDTASDEGSSSSGSTTSSSATGSTTTTSGTDGEGSTTEGSSSESSGSTSSSSGESDGTGSTGTSSSEGASGSEGSSESTGGMHQACTDGCAVEFMCGTQWASEEECIDWCEQNLVEAGLFSQYCADAWEALSACFGTLSCEEFLEHEAPREFPYPCAEEDSVLAVECKGQ